MILITLVLALSGCSEDKKEENTQPVAKETTTTSTEETKEKAEPVDETAYPMPILDGWVEDEISFKVISEGKIEVWHGEFTFENPTEDYFEPYQAALRDDGFVVEVTDDSEGFQTLRIHKVIGGKEYVGNVLFTQGRVTNGLQHFK